MPEKKCCYRIFEEIPDIDFIRLNHIFPVNPACFHWLSAVFLAVLKEADIELFVYFRLDCMEMVHGNILYNEVLK